MLLEASYTFDSVNRSAFPNSASYSDDGQIVLVTHANLQILTPSLGLALKADRSAALSGYPGNKAIEQWQEEKAYEHFAEGECRGLPMFRAVIEIAKREVEWEGWTNDARLAVTGGLDNGWKAASWSPSGLSELGGCLLAALNANREVFVFTPSSDPIKGAWNASFELSNVMLNNLLDQNPELVDLRGFNVSPAQRMQRESLVMQAQASAIAWSPGTPNHAFRDDSLLAVGHRSGDVSFWRYDGDGGMTLVGVHRAAKLWVLGLAWTEWITSKDPSTGQEIHKARLAVSASSGPMTILSVSIPAEGSITVENVRDVSHSRKTVTCMKWIPEKGQLAFARLGEMGIWTSEATTVLRIPVESFRGWTSLANPVDIIYRQQTDSIQVLLSDGTFRVVTGASTANPRLLNLAGQSQNPDDGSASESYRLSADLRTPLMNIEKVMAKRKATIPSTLVPIVTGCLRFSEDDGTQTTLIQYERDMLDMKVYNVANLHKTTIFVVKLSEDDLASKMLEHLTQILAHSHAVSPSKALFPLLLSTRHVLQDEDVASQVLDTLIKEMRLLVDGPAEDLGSASAVLDSATLRRMQLASLMASYWASTTLHGLDAQFAEIAALLRIRIYIVVFSSLRSVLSVGRAGPRGILFERYEKIVQMLSDREARLRETSEISSMQLQLLDSSIIDPGLHRHQHQQRVNAESLGAELDEHDRCAACRAVIAFDTLGRAACRNGHQWLRCSITLAVLSTASVRTCSVCGRKSRMPSGTSTHIRKKQSNGDKHQTKEGVDGDVAAAGHDQGTAQHQRRQEEQMNEEEDVERELLASAKHCLFCGGRWTRGH